MILITTPQQYLSAKTSMSQFLVKSHKFKAENVIISKLEETQNGKPVFRLKYRYNENVIGPLNIQMDYKFVKTGITGMDGDKPAVISPVTQDSLSLAFSDNEIFTDKESYFINEIVKMEENIKMAIKPYAHDLFDGIDGDEDDLFMKKIIDSKFNNSIKYSFEKDPNTGKKTKKRDHKYTSLRLKMYKNINQATGKIEYQGNYIPFGETKPVPLTLDNYSTVVPKWCTVKSIIKAGSVWIVRTTGAGITWLPDRIGVVSVSEGYKETEFEVDSDEEEIPVFVSAKQPESPVDVLPEIPSEDELDELVAATIPVKITERKRRVSVK